MLDPQRYQRAKAVFFSACERPRDERASFIADECAGDDELRAVVGELLAHDDDPLSVIGDGSAATPMRLHLQQLADASAGRQPSSIHSAGPLPERIGRYRILSRLGEGGMGVVYLAEQENPRRQVALKVIAHGHASRQMLRRFEHEAQILGRLHHPGIAQVYEAGMHDDGRGGQPFFAMELVRGRPLTQHCDKTNADLRERLRLFIAICEAVQHAHQQGVIHRDLKPANVLVESRDEETERRRDEVEEGWRATTSSLRLSVSSSLCQPKILDFGVARLTDSDVQATTMHTQADQLVGTLAYMSPEQMSGKADAIDTRSDVYALGVILFELLAGRLPHDVSGKTLPEMIRTISDAEPASLSSINRAYRGDLETIAGKAMERDKALRYQSAGDLAADVRRYLNDEPISARPPSTIYQFRKFARRNKALVGGFAAVFLALVAGMITTTWQRQQARQAATLARDEADKANAVSTFLRRMLASANPHAARGRGFTVRQLLDEFAAQTDEAFLAQPDVRAMVLETMGGSYQSLGELAVAEPLLREAMEIRRTRAKGGDTHALVEILMQYGWLQHDRGDFADAEATLRESLAMAQRLYPARDNDVVPRAMAALGDVLRHLGRMPEAVALLEDSVRLLRTPMPSGSGYLSNTLCFLADAIEESGRTREAANLMREALAIESREDGDATPSAAMIMSNLGVMLDELGEFEEAEYLQRRAIELGRQHLDDEHPEMAKRWNNLAMVLGEIGQVDEAQQCYQRAIAMHRGHPEYDATNLAYMLQNLAAMLAGNERSDEALPLIQEAMEVGRGDSSAHRVDHATRQGLFADILLKLGRDDEAVAQAEQSLETLRTELGDAHDSTLRGMHRLGRMHLAQRRFEQAIVLLQPAAAGLRDQNGPMTREAVRAVTDLADAYLQARRPAEASDLLAGALQPTVDSLGEMSIHADRLLNMLFIAYARQDRLADCQAALSRRIEVWNRHKIDEPELMMDMLQGLALCTLRQELWSDAERAVRDGMVLAERLGWPPQATARLRWRLGAALAGQGRTVEAEPLLLQAYEVVRTGARTDDLVSTCAWLIHIYEALGRTQDAARFRAEYTAATQPASSQQP